MSGLVIGLGLPAGAEDPAPELLAAVTGTVAQGAVGCNVPGMPTGEGTNVLFSGVVITGGFHPEGWPTPNNFWIGQVAVNPPGIPACAQDLTEFGNGAINVGTVGTGGFTGAAPLANLGCPGALTGVLNGGVFTQLGTLAIAGIGLKWTEPGGLCDNGLLGDWVEGLAVLHVIPGQIVNAPDVVTGVVTG
ncbi:MAG: hypothetical protein ACYDH6_19750 [Acidimicrobiales bacterium]